ncbi:MAG: TolC family protein [Candidatus Aminicenantes bacterium]|nr:TolC family protein [Candidatus Aminicenantes bacterium]
MKKVKLLFVLIALFANLFILAQDKPAQAEQAGEVPGQKEITLKEAIFIALKNNLDLQISMIAAENSRNSVRISNADFIPQLSIDLTTQESEYPSTGVLAGADIVNNKYLAMDLSISQKLAIGGDLIITLQNQRSESNVTWNTVNPSLSSRLQIILNQPLLKGFGTLAAKKNIYVAFTDQKKSEFQLKRQILDLVYTLENAYWNLVFAFQNLDTMKMSLKRSQDLLKQNRIKVKVGAAAPIDIFDAEANVAADESNLLQAEQAIQNAEEELKKLLNMSSLEQAIIPTDRPEVKKIDVDFNAFLLEALEKRPDVQQAKLDLKRYKIEVKYARNQMMPDLQLSAQYWTTGQGGDQLITEGNIFLGNYRVIGVIKKDIWETMKDTFSNLYKNYSLMLSLKIPISNSRERALLSMAKLQLESSFLTLKNTENTVYSEVKQAIRSLESNLKLVDAQKIRLELEDKKLKAEEKKLAVGLVSNYDVILKQREYVAAQTNHLNALKNFNMSIADINRKLCRTFDAYDIKFTDFLKK